ncbi:pseudouridine synthase family protein, partial [Vibrio parahaemolyticus V-223/04]
VFESSIP